MSCIKSEDSVEKSEFQNLIRTRKTTNIFLLILIAGLIAWNIYYTCNLFPRERDLRPDYLGVIVTVLSILVTLLVGWQIFYNLSLKNDLEKQLEKSKEDIESTKNELQTKISNKVLLTKAEVYAVSSLSALNSNQNDMAISVFYKSIDSYFNVPEPERKEDTFGVLSFLRRVSAMLPHTIRFSEKQLHVFEDTASKSGDSDIIAYTQKLVEYNQKHSNTTDKQSQQ